MARKRASLKDKGAETLGLTQKKGKGIDVLFGGPSTPRATDEAASPATDAAAESRATKVVSPPEPQRAQAPVDADNDLSALVDETSAPPPPVARPSPVTPPSPKAPPSPVTPPPPTPTTIVTVSDSLPVNEADDDADITSSEEVVDELGLPVAMESPPSDLELATPIAEPALEPAIEVAPPIPPPESLPVAEPAPPASLPESLPMDEADEADDDLSGLVAEDDLSGLAAEAEAAPTTIPPANLPPSPPPMTAAPAEVSPSPPVSTPPVSSTYTLPTSAPSPAPYRPPTPTTSTTYTARPSTLGKPPSTATGAPSLSMPRAKIESVSGIAAQKMEIDEKDIAPEDTKLAEDGYILKVEKRAEVEEDEEKARKVIRYIGRDRRENLDREIESLYKEVSTKLSSKPEEVSSALKVLREAQDIIFEDARQYDEALYRVATVRAMLAHKQHLGRWSYTWGLFVFFYAVTWFIAFVAGLMFVLIFKDRFIDVMSLTNTNVDTTRLALTSAMAGGIGGVSGILYSLYWHVSHKRDFDPQYIMYYLTQPILGFILGAVIYFITAAGFLIVDFSTGRTTGDSTLISPVVVALQVVLGWIAGFRQRVVLEMVEKIIRRILGKSEDTDETEEPESSTPVRVVETVQPPPSET